MASRVLPLLVAVVLSLPPIRFVIGSFKSEAIDYESPAWHAREAMLARARVFLPDALDPRSLDLTTSARDSRPPGDELRCTYHPKAVKATSPKFDCRLDDGTIVKVKYGRTPERMGETAATRLLTALGFAADHVSVVRKVHCVGCPPFPFETRRILEWFYASRLLDAMAPHVGVREYEWAGVERKFEGESIEVPHYEGWDWWELDRVKPEVGGASRDDLDTLRLMAVFLAHWDNKHPNQRLVCPGKDVDDEEQPVVTCEAPILMLQDVGATFGPTKVNFQGWRTAPIWKGDTGCVIGMETLPYGGAGFRPAPITDAARVNLGRRLSALSDAQIRQLFEGARFPDPATGEPGDVSAWVSLFKERVRQITDRPTCPSLTD